MTSVPVSAEFMVEFPLEILNLAEDMSEPNQWYVTGDLRLEPGWDDYSNYEARDYLLTHGITSDPESSAFYSVITPDREPAQHVYELLVPWWTERAQAAFAVHPEWFERVATGD